MILIIGCGFLGQYVLKELLSKTEERIVCTYNSEKPVLNFETPERVVFKKCDVTNEKDLLELNEFCAKEEKTVFYFAASHNIDFVFKNPDKARSVNIDGLKQFMVSVKGIKSLFFASSDCVYGESKPGQAPFKETDRCEPINEYGRQKKEAESIVLNNGFNVLRFSLLYGASLCEKKNFYDKVFSDLKDGKTVEMIFGFSRNALTYDRAASAVVKLAFECENVPQIINVSADELMDKYQLGLLIADCASANRELIKKISAREGFYFFEDKRAECILLNNDLMNTLIRKSN